MAKVKKRSQVAEEIEDDIDVEDVDIDEDEVVEPKAAKKKGKAPKGKKIEEPKKDKKAKKGEMPKHMQVPDNMVTVVQLEEEYGVVGKTIRTILRDNDFEKSEGMGRWAWKKSDPELKRLRGLITGRGSKAEKAEAPKKSAKKEEEEAPAKKKKKK